MSASLQSLGLPSEALVWQVVILTAVSFFVGLLGGFVGLALGTMRLPSLLLMGFPAPVAAGTNILVSSLSAASGSIRHFRERRVDLQTVVVMGLPSFLGAFIGGFASGHVPEGVLIGAAGVLVTSQGAELLARGRRGGGSKAGDPSHPPANSPLVSLTTKNAGFVGLVGLAIGLLGGAVGLILGSLRLPVLVRFLRLDPRIAAGSNLVIGFVMGTFGWIGHVVQGQVDYPLLSFMALSGMLGSYYGARLTGKVSLNTLVLIMGLVLLIVGVLLLFEGVRRSNL